MPFPRLPSAHLAPLCQRKDVSTMTRADAIKGFFPVPGNPVTNGELLELAKADKKAYEELGDECLKALQNQPA